MGSILFWCHSLPWRFCSEWQLLSNVKSHDVKISFSEWKVEEARSLLSLQPVWVHVTGVPPPLRHFLGLRAVGSVIGTTQVVDLLCLRHHSIVRIQVAVHSTDIFVKKGGSNEASVSTDVYVKLNGYEFRYVLEEDDFVPDVDFVPRIWERHDDGHDDGANRDEDIPDRDATKRDKNTQNDSGNTSSGARTVTNVVPMKTATVGTVRHSNVVFPSLIHAAHTDGQNIQRTVEPEGATLGHMQAATDRKSVV